MRLCLLEQYNERESRCLNTKIEQTSPGRSGHSVALYRSLGSKPLLCDPLWYGGVNVWDRSMGNTLRSRTMCDSRDIQTNKRIFHDGKIICRPGVYFTGAPGVRHIHAGTPGTPGKGFPMYLGARKLRLRLRRSRPALHLPHHTMTRLCTQQ